MELLQWLNTARSAGPMSWPMWLLWLQTSDVTGTAGGGMSTTTVLWILLSGAGTTITALAGLLWRTEHSARIKAEEKLEKFQELAPDLAENVRWLVEEASERSPERGMPWPVVRRSSPDRSAVRPTARRRKP